MQAVLSWSPELGMRIATARVLFLQCPLYRMLRFVKKALERITPYILSDANAHVISGGSTLQDVGTGRSTNTIA